MRDCIVLLGRAGLEYHDEQGIKYFVDSEYVWEMNMIMLYMLTV